MASFNILMAAVLLLLKVHVPCMFDNRELEIQAALSSPYKNRKENTVHTL